MLSVRSTCGAVSEMRPPPAVATINDGNFSVKFCELEVSVSLVPPESPTVTPPPPAIPAVWSSDWIWLCSAVSKLDALPSSRWRTEPARITAPLTALKFVETNVSVYVLPLCVTVTVSLKPLIPVIADCTSAELAPIASAAVVRPGPTVIVKLPVVPGIARVPLCVLIVAAVSGTPGVRPAAIAAASSASCTCAASAFCDDTVVRVWSTVTLSACSVAELSSPPGSPTSLSKW